MTVHITKNGLRELRGQESATVDDDRRACTGVRYTLEMLAEMEGVHVTHGFAKKRLKRIDCNDCRVLVDKALEETFTTGPGAST